MSVVHNPWVVLSVMETSLFVELLSLFKSSPYWDKMEMLESVCQMGYVCYFLYHIQTCILVNLHVRPEGGSIVYTMKPYSWNRGLFMLWVIGILIRFSWSVHVCGKLLLWYEGVGWTWWSCYSSFPSKQETLNHQSGTEFSLIFLVAEIETVLLSGGNSSL